MNRQDRRHLVALAAALFVATLAGGCGKEAEAPKPSPAAGKHESASPSPGEQRLTLSAQEAQAAGLEVSAVALQDLVERIGATATIRANQDRLANVSPRITGKVVRVLAELGERVRQGQSLALIDSIEVGESQSAYAQARSELDLARANFDRLAKLYAEQIISEKDYLRAKAEHDKARAILQAASEKRQMLGAGDTDPGTAASTYPLVAPFAGTVIAKKAVLGELAQPDRPLFEVADLSTVWIETNVFEKDLGKIAVGAPAWVSVAAYSDEKFRGRVTYVSSVMDKETRTAKARVEVPNADGRLKLEMFATVEIETAARGKAVIVPEDAVVLLQGVPTAFVQASHGFEARAIQPGEKLRGRVVVRSGLRDGERIAVRGAYALKAKLLKSQIGDEH